MTLTVTGSLGLATSTSHTVTVNPPRFSARLSARGRQRLTAVLKRGVVVSVFTNTAAKASFVFTMPSAHRPSRSASTASASPRHGRALSCGPGPSAYDSGIHSASLKLSRATAAKLRTASKPMTLTVQMTLTDVYGRTIARSVKLTVTR